MAIRGLSSYNAAINALSSRAGRMTNNERLNTLIKRSSVNAQMLKKASDLSNARFNKVNSDVSDTADKTEITENKTRYQIGQELKDNTKALYSSAAKLMNGKELSDEDMAEAFKEFAANYNSSVDSLNASTNSLASGSGKKMTDLANSYSVSLEHIGVSVNDDNTLSLDEGKMKNSISSVREMFGDNYSFGGKLIKKISELESIAQFTGTSIGIYSRTGSYIGR